MASYTSPTDNTPVTFPGKAILNGVEVASYNREIISESPIEVKVTGTYDTSKAPKGGGGDALHSFQSRKLDKFGGRVNDAVILALLEVYEKGFNPFVKSFTTEFTPNKTSGPKVTWQAIITESPDGNAYVGFQSRGGAGNVGPEESGKAVNRALKQANEKKKDLPTELGEPNMIQKDVFDYRNDPAVIRQIFWQYTKPKAYPPKPKSALAGENPTGTQSTTVSSSGPVGASVSQTAISATTSNTKIKLVKKSGPGEIMGEVEKEAFFGEVIFSGLQFDQPGEYVISAVPSSSEVETKDFTITVLGLVEQPQEPQAKEEEPIEGSRPIITQIDKPTYILKPIEFETSRSTPGDQDYAKNLGFIPFFWYMGYQINERDIKSLTLYHEGLIPKVKITFTDNLGIMKKEGVPLDNTKFEIFMNSGSQNLKFVHLKFKLENFQNNRKGSYTVTGTLDLKDFYKPSYKSYTGTSFEVLRAISKELELGFNSNITNTTDSMKWANTGKLPGEFINEIINHSYISDEAFLMGYIDFNYCFNYVDVEKEWKRDISEDLNIVSQGVQGALSQPPNGDEDKIVRLRLTNDRSEQGSNLFINKYQLNNASTKQSITKGQFSITKFYDTFSKSFLVFNIDSLTSDSDKVVILKGTPTDEKELETNYRTKYEGRVDLENVHKNYLYARLQNKTNFDNLARITVELELPNPNFNLYRFMKLDIVFVNHKVSPTSEELIQTRISGEWIVLEIIYNWTGGKMTQNLVCARKELGKLPEELKNQETTKKKETNTERNENPSETAGAGVPNSVYQVGEIYTVRDKAGKQFTVTITEVSPNGIEVTANVDELQGPSETNTSPVGTSGTSGTGATTSSTGTTGTSETSVNSGTSASRVSTFEVIERKSPNGYTYTYEILSDGKSHKVYAHLGGVVNSENIGTSKAGIIKGMSSIYSLTPGTDGYKSKENMVSDLADSLLDI